MWRAQDCVQQWNNYWPRDLLCSTADMLLQTPGPMSCSQPRAGPWTPGLYSETNPRSAGRNNKDLAGQEVLHNVEIYHGNTCTCPCQRPGQDCLCSPSNALNSISPASLMHSQHRCLPQHWAVYRYCPWDQAGKAAVGTHGQKATEFCGTYGLICCLGIHTLLPDSEVERILHICF